MKQLLEDMKTGQFRQVYLLYGEENYLKNQYRDRMKEALEHGNPIILAMGPGDFTASGHYIVLTGVVDGLFAVNDPNSPERSSRLWSYEEISGQIRNIWAVSGRDYAVMPIDE